MFTTRHRRRSWRRDLSLFISQLYRGVPGKAPVGDSQKPNTPNTTNTPNTAKLEPETSRANQSRLGPSFLVKGEISGKEDLLIDGLFEGVVRLSDGKLVIGPTAAVKADVMAAEVVISGNVRGNVRARGRIEIRNDGSVTGDLTTPQVFIEEGALFKGSIEIEKSTEKEVALSEKESGPAKATATAAGASDV